MNFKYPVFLGSLLLVTTLPITSLGAPKSKGKTFFAPGSELYDTRSCQGSVHYRGRKSTFFDFVKLDLAQSGFATVQFLGKECYEFSGPWHLVRPNEFHVDFNNGEGGKLRGSKGKGTATITTRQNHFYKLKMQGVFGGDHLTANFIVKNPSR